ncbi:DUF6517 family protein [Natronobiforma cellulositropha]|uniref:DUF6517 family protein n=1 Tax=Natronobiforma cellulositropha TaxID=1679076 RepID=UPI0021D58162|nr:DUF6517 family protein [Natronobiforma cellulositropha]
MKRRHVIAGLAGTAVLGAGGAFVLYGDQLTEHAASPVSVAASARADTGYEETDFEAIVVSESVAGVGEVTVTNYLTEHEKRVDMGPLGDQRGAVFIALSTPQVRLLGREFNPVEDMSSDDLVALVQDNYDGISNVRRDEDASVTILEQSTGRTRYVADAEFDGSSVEVDLHVSEAVATDEDLVVTIGVYPRELRSLEEENVLELMREVVDERPDAAEEESTESESDGDDGGDDERDGADDSESDGSGGSDDGDADESDDESDDGDGGLLAV